MAILDTDILKSPVDDIKETKVLVTILGGEPVHGTLESLGQTATASTQ
jgi:predicted amidohydrolase YtcJ